MNFRRVHAVLGTKEKASTRVSLEFTDCNDVKLKPHDNDLIIGSATRKALQKLSHDQLKHILLGMHTFLAQQFQNLGGSYLYRTVAGTTQMLESTKKFNRVKCDIC